MATYNLGPIFGVDHNTPPTQGQYRTVANYPWGDVHESCHLGNRLDGRGTTYYCHYTVKINNPRADFHVGWRASHPSKTPVYWSTPGNAVMSNDIKLLLDHFFTTHPLRQPDESLVGTPPASPHYFGKSPVRKRKSPIRKRKSPVRRPKSPVRKRKSPVRKRKSPVRKHKTLKFGSCNSCSQGGNYFSFGKSNMTHLNIPTNSNWLRGSSYDNMTGFKYSLPTNGYVVPPGGVSRSTKMSMVAKPKSINNVPHMHFGRVCFGS